MKPLAVVTIHGHTAVPKEVASVEECFRDAVEAISQATHMPQNKLGVSSQALTTDGSWEQFRWFLYPHEAAGYLMGHSDIVVPARPFTVAEFPAASSEDSPAIKSSTAAVAEEIAALDSLYQQALEEIATLRAQLAAGVKFFVINEGRCLTNCNLVFSTARASVRARI
jgi:hypothetical protein